MANERLASNNEDNRQCLLMSSRESRDVPLILCLAFNEISKHKFEAEVIVQKSRYTFTNVRDRFSNLSIILYFYVVLECVMYYIIL